MHLPRGLDVDGPFPEEFDLFSDGAVQSMDKSRVHLRMSFGSVLAAIVRVPNGLRALGNVLSAAAEIYMIAIAPPDVRRKTVFGFTCHDTLNRLGRYP